MMFCYGIPLVIIEVLMLSKWSLSNDFWGSGIVLASLFIAGFMDNAASYIVFYIGCGISLLVTVIQLDKLK